MYYIKLTAPLFLLLFYNMAHAGEEPTLCTGKETTLFSCKAGNKVVSIYSTPDLSLNSGQLTNKFGLPNKTPELIYPPKPMLVETAFSYS